MTADSTRGTQVILLTGHGDPEYRRRAFEAGCKACLLKPVDINQLMTEISRLTAGVARILVFTHQPEACLG